MELFTGEDNYQLIRIPSGIINGFKTIGAKTAIVANCATLPHEPDEMIQCSHCGERIKRAGGKFIKEPAEPEKEFDLLSVE